MKHSLNQFRWYRKYVGGNWVRVNTHLPMSTFWCEESKMPKCCGSHVIDSESYTICKKIFGNSDTIR